MEPGGLAIAEIDHKGIIQSFSIRENSSGRFVDMDTSGNHIRAFMSETDTELFMEHLRYTLKTGKEMRNTHMVHLNGEIDYRFAHIRRLTKNIAKVFLTCDLPRKGNKKCSG